MDKDFAVDVTKQVTAYEVTDEQIPTESSRIS